MKDQQAAATADLRKLISNLQVAQKDIGRVSDAILDETATLIEELMKMYVPVRTGKLKNSIRVINSPGKRIIGPQGVDYAAYQEFGTATRGEFGGPMYEIKPKKPGGKLHFQIDGKHIQTSVVHHPGIAPNPYVRPAAKEGIQQIDKKYGNAGTNLILKGKYK